MPEENAGNGEQTDDDKVMLSKEDADRLRAAADRNAETAAENEKLRKQIAFGAAGVDLTSEGGKLLFDAVTPGDDGYDIDAITESARAINALATSDGGPEPVGDEATSTDERQRLAGGTTPPPGADQGERPQEIAKRAHEETLKAGGRTEAARTAYVEAIFEAASAGDDRVLVDYDAPASVR